MLQKHRQSASKICLRARETLDRLPKVESANSDELQTFLFNKWISSFLKMRKKWRFITTVILNVWTYLNKALEFCCNFLDAFIPERVVLCPTTRPCFGLRCSIDCSNIGTWIDKTGGLSFSVCFDYAGFLFSFVGVFSWVENFLLSVFAFFWDVAHKKNHHPCTRFHFLCCLAPLILSFFFCIIFTFFPLIIPVSVVETIVHFFFLDSHLKYFSSTDRMHQNHLFLAMFGAC